MPPKITRATGKLPNACKLLICTLHPKRRPFTGCDIRPIMPMGNNGGAEGILMFLLRHGQSFFNLHFTESKVDPGIEDPELTPLGYQQAETAAVRLAALTITRVIVSPYTRAIQTAEPVIERLKVPALIMHEVRERAAFTCDVGSTRERLAVRFPQHDFDALPAVWWPGRIETAQETIDRAAAFRAKAAAWQDAATTLLVSHWAFILALSGVSLKNGEILDYDVTQPAPLELCWQH